MSFSRLIKVICLILVIALAGCITKPTNEKLSGEKLTVGLQSTPSSALVIIASDNGYFEEEDLDVELVEFTAGKFALQAFLADKIDFAVVGDVPVVLANMNGNKFSVLSQTVSSTSENRVVVLKDGSLPDPEPAGYFLSKKRKLATSIGGTPEFYTYNFLKYYNISPNSVEIIAQKPEDMPVTLTTGAVDGISIFEPYPSISEDMLPNKTLTFTIPASVYSPLYVLVARDEWVNANPDKATAFMRALIKAQRFIENEPATAQEIVAKRTKFSVQQIKSIWSHYKIAATITPELMQYWDAEAEWAIQTNKSQSQKPDFSKILRKEFLDKARAG